MRRIHHKRCFGMLFSIAVGLMVSLTVAPARAADLELLTDEKILAALKAKSGSRGVLRRVRDRAAAKHNYTIRNYIR